MTWKDYNHIGSEENKSIHIIHSLKKKERNTTTCIAIHSSTGCRSKSWFAVAAHSFVHTAHMSTSILSVCVLFISSLYNYTHVELYEHRIHLRMPTKDVHTHRTIGTSYTFKNAHKRRSHSAAQGPVLLYLQPVGLWLGYRFSLFLREAARPGSPRVSIRPCSSAGSVPSHRPVQLTRIKLECWLLPERTFTNEEHVEMNASNMFQWMEKLSIIRSSEGATLSCPRAPSRPLTAKSPTPLSLFPPGNINSVRSFYIFITEVR